MAPPLLDLPSGPAIVRATLLLGALSTAQLAAARPPTATEEALVSVEFSATGLGETEAEAVAKAREQAWSMAFERMKLPSGVRTHVVGRHPVAKLIAEVPDFLPFKEVSRVPTAGGVKVRFRLEGEAYQRAEARLATVGASFVGPVSMSPLGEVIVVGDSTKILPGTHLIRANGTPLDSLEAAGAMGFAPVIEYDYLGQPGVMDFTPQRDLIRKMAPTCGPCCHGHCPEDDLVPPVLDNEL